MQSWDVIGRKVLTDCAGVLRRHRWKWTAVSLLIGALLLLDLIFPVPAPGRDSPYALLVVARDGTPLRAFPDKHHTWRHPIALDDVSPLYLEALIGYEDRTFWWHPGINPYAILRAGWQWLYHGRVVSGGSTITMQVARLLEPTPRTVSGKARQMLRALQLEWHYSKLEILALYLNYAPMGGVLEGVEAASRAYLGKPAKRLSHAEAALLAVLPQQPSRLRPDRYPQRAQIARDKVVHRMSGTWPETAIADALSEPVVAQTLRDPLLAPLLAQRLKSGARGRTRIDSTIDASAQATLEDLLAGRARMLPPRMSMAAMVMDNASHEVIAYAGSADFTDPDRFSHVDMVRAYRSPGSALKPFLYAFALDEGMIHSESLLSDTPQSFSGYQPGNFQQSFHGPVSVSEALVKSLNVPAVEVLDHLGSGRFVAMLRRGGLRLEFPRGAEPNLSVILGGAGARLEDMVGVYASLARDGMAVTPRFTPDAPQEERRMMSEGAAFIVRDILETGGFAGSVDEGAGSHRGLAWKTGTSFGFRDAWAVGVSPRYTIGVWVGRPDGTPNPGFFGANIAAPLLVDIANAMPDARRGSFPARPANVSRKKICWPTGMPDGSQAPAGRGAGRGAERGAEQVEAETRLCPVQRTAWVMNGTTPPTFPDKLRPGAPLQTFHVDTVSGLRVMPECSRHPSRRLEVARWPASLEPWLEAGLRRKVLPPAWAPECAHLAGQEGSLKIAGLSDGAILHRAQQARDPEVELEVRGVSGEITWMVNGRLLSRQSSARSQKITFSEPGSHDITAFDDLGRYDRITVKLLSGP